MLAKSQLARREPGQTLQATALVHEAWLKIVGEEDPGWECRAHFFGAAARAMRNILVDRARHHAVRRRAAREDPGKIDSWAIEPPLDEILSVHEALNRLEQKDPRMAKIVMLRFFAGCTMKEISETTGEALRTVEELWAYARVWLKRQVEGQIDT